MKHLTLIALACVINGCQKEISSLDQMTNLNKTCRLIRNEAGRPTHIETERHFYDAEYKNDTILSKFIAHIHNYDNTQEFWRYYTFEYDKNNEISAVNEFTKSGQQTGRQQVEYLSQPNTLSFPEGINFANILGMRDILPLFSYMTIPSKLVKVFYEGNANTITRKTEMNYQTDNLGNVISSEGSVFESPSNILIGTYTRKYFYECN